ncbi:hypothetical protein [Methylobacterium iners]|uniref:Transcriptional regulator n=1 Tax=Methylobacterium iners TaxID=418707 RepID=A0ABQ4S2S4_9HYPH|nr:hypothetical protein [Methylobacterium iners]GJD97431.1 hypothetical protein OCOJLMKI_4662 [Methylobacterium iners]
MQNEANDLEETLGYAAMVIAQADAPTALLIETGFHDGCRLSMAMREAGQPMPQRVKACLQRFDECRRNGDHAAAGWMLAAAKTRLERMDLAGSEELKALVDATLKELSRKAGTTRH